MRRLCRRQSEERQPCAADASGKQWSDHWPIRWLVWPTCCPPEKQRLRQLQNRSESVLRRSNAPSIQQRSVGVSVMGSGNDPIVAAVAAYPSGRERTGRENSEAFARLEHHVFVHSTSP